MGRPSGLRRELLAEAKAENALNQAKAHIRQKQAEVMKFSKARSIKDEG